MERLGAEMLKAEDRVGFDSTGRIPQRLRVRGTLAMGGDGRPGTVNGAEMPSQLSEAAAAWIRSDRRAIRPDIQTAQIRYG